MGIRLLSKYKKKDYIVLGLYCAPYGVLSATREGRLRILPTGFL